jgi:hypothetical protein
MKGGVAVQLDIGIVGLGLLVVIALGFGVIVQVAAWRVATHWLWLLGAVAWFIGGFVASEVVWGTLTVDEIQPIIDGLAFDESLLGGLALGVPVVLIAWYATRRSRSRQPASS